MLILVFVLGFMVSRIMGDRLVEGSDGGINYKNELKECLKKKNIAVIAYNRVIDSMGGKSDGSIS
tara:strand:+ start:826 stop:1020 length:195 start_codon:yes stop_codon:yes gene_type:complete